MKNTITAIILILAMLLSLSSCLTAINVAGQDGTETYNNTEEKMTEDNITTELIDSSDDPEIETNETETAEDRNTEITTDEPADTENTDTDLEPVIYDPKSIETKDVSTLENVNIPDNPSKELLEQIAGDFAAFMNKKFNYRLSAEELKGFYVERYYGEYNGAVPVKVEGLLHTTAVELYVVAGYGVWNNDGNKIWVWKDGNFYLLSDAYENGILTEEDIANIAWLSYYGKYVNLPRPE
ncbi:MAG: hypothetical protein IKS28_00445 [Clostridia bacterium]|nr:hypothetical protein [Clostridia bacterium]